MRIALNIGGHHHDLGSIHTQAAAAADDGLAGVWMSQIFGPDALTALALVGQHVNDLGEPADVSGEEITARGRLEIDAPSAPPVLVAALGPRMLHLAGTHAAGTTLWMVGPKTIANHIAPTVRHAAADAGRPEPRILAGVTAVVTDDPDAAHERSASEQGVYGSLPAYQHMMRAEGVEGPADLVIAGDEDTVTKGLQRYGEAGATDLRVTILAGDDDERARTRGALRTMSSG